MHLWQLHWLTIAWRIDFKLAVLVYKCLHGLAPSYLADELHHPAESEFRRCLLSASSHELCSPSSTLNLWRPSFSSRCRSDLEQSSAARHICAVTSRLLHSLEDILLRTALFIKLLSCLRSDIVILDTLIVLLTYLLDIAPLLSETPPQKCSGMARVLKGSHSFTCTATRSSAIAMSHT